MSEFLGIDTSGYTSSVAVYIAEEKRAVHVRKLLPVGEGKLGLRQSDAVFHHTKNLPTVVEELFERHTIKDLKAVSVSSRPKSKESSYMPCFLCGEGLGRSVSAMAGVPLFRTTHQIGHILSALYSADRLDLIENREEFLAFHVSGGTTDCLLCRPCEGEVLSIEEICTSLDLKAGQAVDRAGVMLGMKFPCGGELERLAVNSDRDYKIKINLKDGNCCLSGVENRCRKMLSDGEKPENIARYCLDFIAETISAMTEYAVGECGNLPIIFAGGVMSDKIIKDRIVSKFPWAIFSKPEFSSDNAVGVAIYGYLRQCGF